MKNHLYASYFNPKGMQTIALDFKYKSQQDMQLNRRTVCAVFTMRFSW